MLLIFFLKFGIVKSKQSGAKSAKEVKLLIRNSHQLEIVKFFIIDNFYEKNINSWSSTNITISQNAEILSVRVRVPLLLMPAYTKLDPVEGCITGASHKSLRMAAITDNNKNYNHQHQLHHFHQQPFLVRAHLDLQLPLHHFVFSQFYRYCLLSEGLAWFRSVRAHLV